MKVKELIELLNEYEIKRKKTKMNITDKRNEWDFDNEYTPLIIISKQFWFIERLVKNDKLKDNGIKPRKDLVKEIAIVDYKTGKAIWWKNQYSETEQLIMYLSIQDNPIEYLCKIIKE